MDLTAQDKSRIDDKAYFKAHLKKVVTIFMTIKQIFLLHSQWDYIDNENVINITVKIFMVLKVGFVFFYIFLSNLYLKKIISFWVYERMWNFSMSFTGFYPFNDSLIADFFLMLPKCVKGHRFFLLY